MGRMLVCPPNSHIETYLPKGWCQEEGPREPVVRVEPTQDQGPYTTGPRELPRPFLQVRAPPEAGRRQLHRESPPEPGHAWPSALGLPASRLWEMSVCCLSPRPVEFCDSRPKGPRPSCTRIPQYLSLVTGFCHRGQRVFELRPRWSRKLCISPPGWSVELAYLGPNRRILGALPVGLTVSLKDRHSGLIM